MTSTQRVLVGFDGTDQSRRAVEWAVTEAETRGWPLVVVMAHELVVSRSLMSGPAAAASTLVTSVREEDRKLLNDLEAELREAHPDLDLTVEHVEQTAAGYLVGESEYPGLVVIGTRGLGGIRAALMGAVADEVVTYARGRVAVIP